MPDIEKNTKSAEEIVAPLLAPDSEPVREEQLNVPSNLSTIGYQPVGHEESYEPYTPPPPTAGPPPSGPPSGLAPQPTPYGPPPATIDVGYGAPDLNRRYQGPPEPAYGLAPDYQPLSDPFGGSRIVSQTEFLSGHLTDMGHNLDELNAQMQDAANKGDWGRYDDIRGEYDKLYSDYSLQYLQYRQNTAKLGLFYGPAGMFNALGAANIGAYLGRVNDWASGVDQWSAEQTAIQQNKARQVQFQIYQYQQGTPEDQKSISDMWAKESPAFEEQVRRQKAIAENAIQQSAFLQHQYDMASPDEQARMIDEWVKVSGVPWAAFPVPTSGDIERSHATTYQPYYRPLSLEEMQQKNNEAYALYLKTEPGGTFKPPYPDATWSASDALRPLLDNGAVDQLRWSLFLTAKGMAWGFGTMGKISIPNGLPWVGDTGASDIDLRDVVTGALHGLDWEAKESFKAATYAFWMAQWYAPTVSQVGHYRTGVIEGTSRGGDQETYRSGGDRGYSLHDALAYADQHYRNQSQLERTAGPLVIDAVNLLGTLVKPVELVQDIRKAHRIEAFGKFIEDAKLGGALTDEEAARFASVAGTPTAQQTQLLYDIRNKLATQVNFDAFGVTSNRSKVNLLNYLTTMMYPEIIASGNGRDAAIKILQRIPELAARYQWEGFKAWEVDPDVMHRTAYAISKAFTDRSAIEITAESIRLQIEAENAAAHQALADTPNDAPHMGLETPDVEPLGDMGAPPGSDPATAAQYRIADTTPYRMDARSMAKISDHADSVARVRQRFLVISSTVQDPQIQRSAQQMLEQIADLEASYKILAFTADANMNRVMAPEIDSLLADAERAAAELEVSAKSHRPPLEQRARRKFTLNTPLGQPTDRGYEKTIDMLTSEDPLGVIAAQREAQQLHESAMGAWGEADRMAEEAAAMQRSAEQTMSEFTREWQEKIKAIGDALGQVQVTVGASIGSHPGALASIADVAGESNVTSRQIGALNRYARLYRHDYWAQLKDGPGVNYETVQSLLDVLGRQESAATDPQIKFLKANLPTIPVSGRVPGTVYRQDIDGMGLLKSEAQAWIDGIRHGNLNPDLPYLGKRMTSAEWRAAHPDYAYTDLKLLGRTMADTDPITRAQLKEMERLSRNNQWDLVRQFEENGDYTYAGAKRVMSQITPGQRGKLDSLLRQGKITLKEYQDWLKLKKEEVQPLIGKAEKKPVATRLTDDVRRFIENHGVGIDIQDLRERYMMRVRELLPPLTTPHDADLRARGLLRGDREKQVTRIIKGGSEQLRPMTPGEFHRVLTRMVGWAQDTPLGAPIITLTDLPFPIKKGAERYDNVVEAVYQAHLNGLMDVLYHQDTDIVLVKKFYSEIWNEYSLDTYHTLQEAAAQRAPEAGWTAFDPRPTYSRRKPPTLEEAGVHYKAYRDAHPQNPDLFNKRINDWFKSMRSVGYTDEQLAEAGFFQINEIQGGERRARTVTAAKAREMAEPITGPLTNTPQDTATAATIANMLDNAPVDQSDADAAAEVSRIADESMRTPGAMPPEPAPRTDPAAVRQHEQDLMAFRPGAIGATPAEQARAAMPLFETYQADGTVPVLVNKRSGIVREMLPSQIKQYLDRPESLERGLEQGFVEVYFPTQDRADAFVANRQNDLHLEMAAQDAQPANAPRPAAPPRPEISEEARWRNLTVNANPAVEALPKRRAYMDQLAEQAKLYNWPGEQLLMTAAFEDRLAGVSMRGDEYFNKSLVFAGQADPDLYGLYHPATAAVKPMIEVFHRGPTDEMVATLVHENMHHFIELLSPADRAAFDRIYGVSTAIVPKEIHERAAKDMELAWANVVKKKGLPGLTEEQQNLHGRLIDVMIGLWERLKNYFGDGVLTKEASDMWNDVFRRTPVYDVNVSYRSQNELTQVIESFDEEMRSRGLRELITGERDQAVPPKLRAALREWKIVTERVSQGENRIPLPLWSKRNRRDIADFGEFQVSDAALERLAQNIGRHSADVRRDGAEYLLNQQRERSLAGADTSNMADDQTALFEDEEDPNSPDFLSFRPASTNIYDQSYADELSAWVQETLMPTVVPPPNQHVMVGPHVVMDESGRYLRQIPPGERIPPDLVGQRWAHDHFTGAFQDQISGQTVPAWMVKRDAYTLHAGSLRGYWQNNQMVTYERYAREGLGLHPEEPLPEGFSDVALGRSDRVLVYVKNNEVVAGVDLYRDPGMAQWLVGTMASTSDLSDIERGRALTPILGGLAKHNVTGSHTAMSEDSRNLMHHFSVVKAMLDGESVPTEVLADYPSLAKGRLPKWSEHLRKPLELRLGAILGPGTLARTRQPAQPVVDFTTHAWQNANWADVANEFTQVLNSLYNYEDFVWSLEDMKKLSAQGLVTKGGWLRWGANKAFNWGALTKASSLMKQTDGFVSIVRDVMGQAEFHSADNPYPYIMDELKFIGEAPIDEVLKRYPGFTLPEEISGLRTFRRHWNEDHLLDDAGNRVVGSALKHNLEQHRSDAGITPQFGKWMSRIAPNQGHTWTEQQMDLLDRLITNGMGSLTAKEKKALKFSKEDKDLLTQIRAMPAGRSKVKGKTPESIGNAWNRLRAQFMDPVTNTFLPQTDPAAIDQALNLITQNEAPDTERFLESIATSMMEREASRINYDPGDIDFALKAMIVVKNNLTPFWMTAIPRYHINNIAGNLMAMVLGAMRSDLHVHPSLRTPEKFARNYGRAASRVGGSPFLRSYTDYELAGDAGAAEYVRRAGRKYKTYNPLRETQAMRGQNYERGFVDKADIHNVPGFKQVFDWSENQAAHVEQKFREIVYGQAWTHAYDSHWLPTVEEWGITNQDLLQQLREAGGYDEVMQAIQSAARQGDRWALDQDNVRLAESAWQYANAAGQVEGYRATREVLRDYRMRNRLDFVLDHIVPIHFWTNKNLAFVTKTALDRPLAAAAGMKVYDAWNQNRSDMPAHLRAGYTDFGFVPGLDHLLAKAGVGTWQWRSQQLTNPALFALPKLLDPDRWNHFKYGGWGLINSAGAGAVGNFWNAMGYRMSPQADVVFGRLPLLAAHFSKNAKNLEQATSYDRFATWMLAPNGYKQDLLPFESNLRAEPHIWEHVLRPFYSATGFDGGFTKMELQGIGYTWQEMVANREVTLKPGETTTSRWAEVLADIKSGHPTDPDAVRVVGRYLHQQSMGSMWSMLGASHADYGQAAQKVYNAQVKFDQIRKSSEPKGLADARAQATSLQFQHTYGYRQPFMLWLSMQIDANRVDPKDAEEAVQQVFQNGDLDNPVFREFVGDISFYLDHPHGEELDASVLQKAVAAYDKFHEIAKTSSTSHAFDAAFGTYDSNGKRNGGQIPDILITMSSGLSIDELRQHTQETDYYAWLRAQRHEQELARRENNAKYREYEPYFAESDRIEQELTKCLGSPNGAIQAGCWRTYDRQHRQLKVQFPDLPALPKSFPKSGDLSRRVRDGETPNVRLFWNPGPASNRAIEYSTAQKQRGEVLDTILDQLGLAPYIGNDPNPRFMVADTSIDSQGNITTSSTKHFDWDAWQQAVDAAAPDAVRLYGQNLESFRRDIVQGGGDMDLVNQPQFLSLSEDDWRYHNRDKRAGAQAFEDQAFAAVKNWHTTYKTSDQRASPEAIAAKQAIDREYGATYFYRYENEEYKPRQDSQGRNVGIDDYRYNEGGRMVEDIYHTLSPADRKAFKERYASAFVDAVNPDTKEKYTDLDRTHLTTDQVIEILRDHGIDYEELGNPTFNAESRRAGDNRPTPQQQAVRRDEAQRVDDAETVAHYTDLFYNGISESDREALAKWNDYRDTPLEQKAQALIDANVQTNSRGETYKSWSAVVDELNTQITDMIAHGVDQDTVDGAIALRDYIEGRQQLSADLGIPDITKSRRQWFESLPDDLQSLLLTEAPGTFGFLSGDDSSGSSGSGSTSSGSSSTTATTHFTKSSGSSYSPSSTPYRASGSSSRGGSQASTSQTSGLSLTLSNLDPSISTVGFTNDGRMEIINQIADTIRHRTSYLQVLGPQWQNYYQALLSLLLQNYAKRLGPNPTLANWQALLDSIQPATPPPAVGPLQSTTPQAVANPSPIAAIGYPIQP